MPLFKIVVRAEECREYFVEAESLGAAYNDFEEIDAGDRGKPHKEYWNTESIDDPEECCPHCKASYDTSLFLMPCCEAGRHPWAEWAKENHAKV